jgi:hypothetical protein
MTPKLGSKWRVKYTDEPDNNVWTVASIGLDYKLVHLTFGERKITVDFEWFELRGIAC